MRTPIRIGLIRFGCMGQAHSRSYLSIPLYFPEAGFRPVLAAVADTVPTRISQAVDDFGYSTGTSGWRELVARADIDVTAPNAMHQVFTEEEAAARRAGVITGYGYNYRWRSLVRYARDLVETGRVGTPTHYLGRFFSMYGQDRLGLLSWRFLQDKAGYGALSDIMSHAIDIARFMFGPIRRVVATGRPSSLDSWKSREVKGSPAYAQVIQVVSAVRRRRLLSLRRRRTAG